MTRVLPISIFLATTMLALPALAWEYGSTDLGEGQIIHHVAAIDLDQTGNAIFGCNSMVPGEIQFQLVTSRPADGERPATAELVVGGQTIRLEGMTGDAEGLQLLATGRTVAAAEAARAVYAASDSFEVTLDGQSYRFEGGAYGDAFGAMLDACG